MSVIPVRASPRRSRAVNSGLAAPSQTRPTSGNFRGGKGDLAGTSGGEGFEPSRDLTAPNGFVDRRKALGERVPGVGGPDLLVGVASSLAPGTRVVYRLDERGGNAYEQIRAANSW